MSNSQPLDFTTGAPVRLWPGDAPGSLGTRDEDIPTLTPYFPATTTGAAVVVCPGGGYGGLAAHEGEDYALWLNTQGITAFVLKYRLGSQGYRHPSMLLDAARAVRLVRHHSSALNIDPKLVGIMGSSAGGHLASTLVTHYDEGNAADSDPIERESSRPAIGILCYAVISMGEHAHEGSKRNLLGDNPPEELVQLLSNELHITPQTPPCFLWHTWEDKGVKIENSLQFVAALQANDVPFDFHVFQEGGHGIGLKSKPPFEDVHPWAHNLTHWLKVQGFVS